MSRSPARPTRLRPLVLAAIAAVLVGLAILPLVTGYDVFALFGNEGNGWPALEPPATQPVQRTWKVLHIMSYHSPWKWTDDQFNGFKAGLGQLNVDYRVYQMDTKRHSTEAWKEQVGGEARRLIETWKPDLVFTSDDNAQEYVTRHYINSEIPFVFCGVNAYPEDYGFQGATNITGVLEREHFLQSARLLKSIVPGARRLAVLTDDGPTWKGTMVRMEALQGKLTDMEIVAFDIIPTFEEYQRKIRAYESSADALALLGIFTFKDRRGANVPYERVSRWTAENSRLPELTFWEDRIAYGHLCTVTVSGYEQGLAAGRMARGILLEGRSPSSYPITPTVRGEPVINLARARRLGLTISSDVLLTAEVIEHFAWEP